MSATRRQDGERTERIMRETIALAQDVGYAGLSIEAVAARARVGKHTIYRRWSSKGALFLDSVLSLHDSDLDYPDTGDLGADLRHQIYDVIDLLSGPAIGPLFRGLLAEAQRDVDVAAAVVERFVEPQTRRTVARLESARAAGQIGPDVDLELAMETLSGPFYYRFLVTHQPLTHDFVDRVVDASLWGLLLRA